MKRLSLLMLLLATSLLGFAETPEHRKENPHEIRIGIADSYMEACLENGGLRFKTIEPYPYRYGPLNHTGHIFVEYQKRVNSWFSAGVNVDYLHSWYYQYRFPMDERYNIDKTTYHSLKLSVIPTIRFTYFHNELVDLYSAVGIGINYTEHMSNDYSIYRTLGLAFDACAFGVSVGKKHWFGAFELGGTTAFGYDLESSRYKPSLELPIPFARLLRISVGYRF